MSRTPSPFSTAEFKKLSKEWDEKLARSGFEDVEMPLYARSEKSRWPDRTLKVFHSTQWGMGRMTFMGGGSPNKAEYFRCASAFLHARHCYPGFKKFSSKRDRRIWSMHCDGLTPREIAPKVRSTFRSDSIRYRPHPRHETVWRSIRKSHEKMLEWLKLEETRGGDSE